MADVIKIETRASGAREDDRRAVIVDKGRIDETADEAVAGLFDENSEYFQRGGELVRMVTAAEAKRSRPGHTAPSLVRAAPAMLQDDLERTCRFIQRTEDKDGAVRLKIVACPKPLPGVILGRAGRLPLPSIRGISEVPLALDDGSIRREGFDASTGVLVALRGKWPPIPQAPTDENARAALARFDELLDGFPFTAELDRAITLAAFLSAVLRPALSTCPAFAWSSPVRGSGKSKLADVASVLATGLPAAALSWPRTEDEAEKRIGAMLLAGDRIVAIDNVERPLKGALLNSMLTQRIIAVRVLGQSEVIRMPAAPLVTATGNNLQLAGDLSRRFLVADLDPEMERPETRHFTFDPVARAQKERKTLVSGLLTIARWGRRMAEPATALGGFEEWSRRVRDPLVALGLPDPCLVLDRLHEADPEREAALELLTEWERAFGGTATTVADAVRQATRHKDSDEQLRDALDRVAGQAGGINSRRLGHYLRRVKDRRIAGKVLRQGHDLLGNVASWRVEKTE